MKKFICILISLAMIFAFVACNKPDDPKDDPQQEEPKENVIANDDFFKLISGQWDCPAQKHSFQVRVYKEDSKYIISLDQDGMVHRTEMKKVVLDDAKKEYTVTLGKMEDDLKIETLHIVFSEKSGAKVLTAENIYDGNKLVEYMQSATEYKYYPLAGKTYKANIEGTPAEYQPFVSFYADGTFDYLENVYAGLIHIKGDFEVIGDEIWCFVTENGDMQGYAGADTFLLTFAIDGDDLTLNSSICMSQPGTKLSLVK